MVRELWIPTPDVTGLKPISALGRRAKNETGMKIMGGRRSWSLGWKLVVVVVVLGQTTARA